MAFLCKVWFLFSFPLFPVKYRIHVTLFISVGANVILFGVNVTFSFC